MKCSCGGEYKIGPAERCEDCGIAKPRRAKQATPLDEPIIVKKALCNNHDYNKFDQETRAKADILYHEGRQFLSEGNPDKAAKKFAEATKVYIQANDGPSAGISNSFSLEYCRSIIQYDKENNAVSKEVDTNDSKNTKQRRGKGKVNQESRSG